MSRRAVSHGSSPACCIARAGQTRNDHYEKNRDTESPRLSRVPGSERRSCSLRCAGCDVLCHARGARVTLAARFPRSGVARCSACVVRSPRDSLALSVRQVSVDPPSVIIVRTDVRDRFIRSFVSIFGITWQISVFRRVPRVFVRPGGKESRTTVSEGRSITPVDTDHISYES